MIDPETRRVMEGHGLPAMKLRVLNGGWQDMRVALEWINEQELALDEKRERAAVEQAELARSSADAAWASVRLAKAALRWTWVVLGVSVLAVAISGLAWLFPRSPH